MQLHCLYVYSWLAVDMSAAVSFRECSYICDPVGNLKAPGIYISSALSVPKLTHIKDDGFYLTVSSQMDIVWLSGAVCCNVAKVTFVHAVNISNSTAFC